MLLHAADGTFNWLFAGIVYGSGALLALALRRPLVRRPLVKKRAKFVGARESVSLLGEGRNTQQTLSVEVVVDREDVALAEDTMPEIEITIEPYSIEQTVAEQTVAEQTVAEPLAQVPIDAVVPDKQQNLSLLAVQKENISELSMPPAEIVCEPVDWKKWKVADLRRASMARAFGVRTRPIGSKRNLRKADLIAQYEQQLNRLTKSPTLAVDELKRA